MSIFKKWLFNGLFVLLVFILNENVISQNTPIKKLRLGISAGLGLPKIPISQFRAPISVMGGTSVTIRFVRKMALQLNGYGLYTFSLGTITNQNDKLRHGYLLIYFVVSGGVFQVKHL